MKNETPKQETPKQMKNRLFNKKIDEIYAPDLK